MDFKENGNLIYCVGTTYPDLGASEYALMKGVKDTTVWTLRNPVQNFDCYATLFSAIQEGLVRSCHDCSDGGLGVALAEMVFLRENLERRSIVRQLSRPGVHRTLNFCSLKSPGRILVEVEPPNAKRMETLFSRLPL